MEAKIKQLLKTIKLNESMLSMIFGVVTVILIGVLVFRMYDSSKSDIAMEGESTEVKTETVGDVKVEVKEDGKKYPTELPEKVTVEAGQHLWMIAEKYYGSGYNWVDIAKENGLANAGQISVGQELKLPKVAVVVVENPKMAEVEPVINKIEGDSYTVVKGDHLWSISVRAYGDGYKWVDVAKANGLKNPGYIEVGQVIKLPR